MFILEYQPSDVYFPLQFERVGYFPAMVVQLNAKRNKALSICSTSSQASVDSGMSGKWVYGRNLRVITGVKYDQSMCIQNAREAMDASKLTGSVCRQQT